MGNSGVARATEWRHFHGNPGNQRYTVWKNPWNEGSSQPYLLRFYLICRFGVWGSRALLEISPWWLSPPKLVKVIVFRGQALARAGPGTPMPAWDLPREIDPGLHGTISQIYSWQTEAQRGSAACLQCREAEGRAGVLDSSAQRVWGRLLSVLLGLSILGE